MRKPSSSASSRCISSASSAKSKTFAFSSMRAYLADLVLRFNNCQITFTTSHGRIPKVFYESDDPDRLVPIVWKPEDYMIAVSGDPLRKNGYVFAHNGFLGYPTGKKIQLPKGWEQKLAQAKLA